MSGMYTKKISQGALFLDEHAPGWRDRIDLQKLNLWSLCDCVLSQALGADHGVSFSPDLGFDVRGGGRPNDYLQITEEWREYICSTRSAVSA